MFTKMLVMAMLLLAGAAHAEKPDLSGAKLVLMGECRMQGVAVPCALYQKEEVRYVILRDDDQVEIVLIYRIRNGATMPYRLIDFELLWSKDDEERMTA
jgi:hypothetical protein